MKAYIRKWVKQEKRIVKLIFQKGLMDNKSPSIKDLYWAYYRHGNKSKRKHGRKYRGNDYLPEVHYGSCDYWGEYDEHGFISMVIDGLYWANTPATWLGQEKGEYPPSSFKYQGRQWFINYLKELPTVNRSSKINRVLRRNQEE